LVDVYHFTGQDDIPMVYALSVGLIISGGLFYALGVRSRRRGAVDAPPAVDRDRAR